MSDDELVVVRVTLDMAVYRAKWLAATCAPPPIPPPGYPADSPWPPAGYRTMIDETIDNIHEDLATFAIAQLGCDDRVQDSEAQLTLVGFTPQHPTAEATAPDGA